MKVKVANSSSKKTREKIKKAFALLIKQNGQLNKVTVTDLVKTADITRGSFYTHYDNIYDVAKDILDETLNVLINNINKLQTLENIDKYFSEIINYIKNNREIYSLILTSNSPLLFTDSLAKIIDHNLYSVLNKKNIKNLELNISLFVDGCINLIIKHFKKEINYSLDDIGIYMQDTFKILFLNE